MNEVKLLDVTLRDGGYKTNFYFPDEVIKKTLTLLDSSGIEYVEVGYRNGSFKPIPNIGPAGLCSQKYLKFCKKWLKNSKLTVIYHPKNIQTDDMEEMKESGVDCVRICFPAQNPLLGYRAIEMAKKNGFEFFVNITRASQYTQKQLTELVCELSRYKPSGIYLADSNGSLTPEKVSDLFSHLQITTNVPFGFHAHDNLFLAQANAIAAINSGVTFIDTSLNGLGKGAGNLRTEGFVSFLHTRGILHYDLCSLLDAAEFIKLKIKDLENYSIIKDIIMGVFDISQDDAVNLGAFLEVKDYYARAKQYQNEKV